MKLLLREFKSLLISIRAFRVIAVQSKVIQHLNSTEPQFLHLAHLYVIIDFYYTLLGNTSQTNQSASIIANARLTKLVHLHKLFTISPDDFELF